jgi:predicted ABC-type exoprotein transport system permease subunit
MESNITEVDVEYLRVHHPKVAALMEDADKVYLVSRQESLGKVVLQGTIGFLIILVASVMIFGIAYGLGQLPR